MNWVDLGVAVSLVLVIEGLLPFAAPNRYRKMVESIGRRSEGQLRSVGLAFIVSGLLLLYLIR
ncbi:MAG: DUF2065 domain-containing protein [Acidiferrobacteraceae bacterium]|nr:DUF2065 domain-containing protein [Acidiferrobacteraceae bacterium]